MATPSTAPTISGVVDPSVLAKVAVIVNVLAVYTCMLLVVGV